MTKNIYLDYAATTPVDDSVQEEMAPFFSEKFGNPSSVHSFGQEALFAIDKARVRVANFLGAREREVIFTSSATQGNNLALQGVLEKEENPHVITSPIEHKAVLEPLKNSKAEVDYLPVYRNGVVKAEDVLEKVKDETVLVSVMYANSEIGTIQPIEEIGKKIKEINKKRKRKIVFHTDAVQAVNYLPCDVNRLGVDLLVMSGHKIYGPKGAGALFVREGITLSPVFYGASQERKINPGTENVPAIVGLGKAIEEIKKNNPKKTKELRDMMITGIEERIEGSFLNGDRERRLPNNVNMSFEGVEGESLVIALDREGIASSTGSACASHSLSPSYVLLALGLSHEMAHGSLRLTLGRGVTQGDVNYLLEKLPPVVERLREISGRGSKK